MYEPFSANDPDCNVQTLQSLYNFYAEVAQLTLQSVVKSTVNGVQWIIDTTSLCQRICAHCCKPLSFPAILDCIPFSTPPYLSVYGVS